MAENYYEEEPINFNHRFKVETNMGPQEGIVDHRHDWSQKQYRKGLNGVYEPPEGSELKTIERGQRKKAEKPKPNPVSRAKRKTKTITDKADAALKKAAQNDLSKRGL